MEKQSFDDSNVADHHEIAVIVNNADYKNVDHWDEYDRVYMFADDYSVVLRFQSDQEWKNTSRNAEIVFEFILFYSKGKWLFTIFDQKKREKKSYFDRILIYVNIYIFSRHKTQKKERCIQRNTHTCMQWEEIRIYLQKLVRSTRRILIWLFCFYLDSLCRE